MISEDEQKYSAFNAFLMQETENPTKYFLEGLFEGEWRLLHQGGYCDNLIFYHNYQQLAKDIIERGIIDRNDNLPTITTSPAKSERAKSDPDFIPTGENGFCAQVQKSSPVYAQAQRRFTGAISLDELTSEIIRLLSKKS